MTGVRTLALAALTLCLTACGAPPRPIPELDLEDVETAVRSSLEEARAAVVEAPGSAGAWGRLAMVADAHGFDAAALAAYRNARELDPEDARWPYFTARLLALDGSRPGEVVELLGDVLARAPDYAPAHVRLAEARLQLDDPDGAARAFRKALELDGDLVQARLGLGRIALERGDVEAAIGHLETARGLAPDDAAVLATLGRAYRRAGRSGDARAAAEAAAAAGPGSLPDPWLEDIGALGVSSSLLFERALARIRGGDFRRAAAELEAVARLRPQDPAVHAELGGAYQALGRSDDAIRAFSRAVELKDDWVEARLQLVGLLLDGDRGGEAQDHLRRLQPLRDRHPLVEGYIALALARQDRLAEAVRRFAWAAERAPLPPQLHAGWGLALAQLGRPADAEPHFREALAGMPGSARIRLFLGLALEAQGRTREAVPLYRESMELEPSPLAAQRLEALRQPARSPRPAFPGG